MAVRTGVARRNAFAFAHDPMPPVERRHLVENPEDRLVERNVDHLSLAGLFRDAQRHQDADRAVHARHVVRQRRRSRRNWRPARLTRKVGKPADRVCNAREARAVLVGAGLPETCHTQHHEARIERHQDIWTEPPFLQRARPEVLRHDIAPPDQLLELFRVLRRFQVERDRALVARLAEPRQRLSFGLGRRPEAAHRIPGGMLDLDHLRAELRQDRRRERGRDERCKIEDAYPVERPAVTDVAGILYRLGAQSCTPILNEVVIWRQVPIFEASCKRSGIDEAHRLALEPSLYVLHRLRIEDAVGIMADVAEMGCQHRAR